MVRQEIARQYSLIKPSTGSSLNDTLLEIARRERERGLRRRDYQTAAFAAFFEDVLHQYAKKQESEGL